jgi:hypothetical protein
MPPVWLPALIKAISTALIVVTASVIAEVIGPFWGALIASLPVSAGPAYVFLAMGHDGDFLAASALSSFAANAAAGVFLLTYALRAGPRSSWNALGTALGAWFAVSLLIRAYPWSAMSALALNLFVFGAGFFFLRTRAVEVSRPTGNWARTWCDLPIRAVAIAVFVTGVVLASAMLGPEATGIAAVFPISLSSLLVVVRPRIGGPASARLAETAFRAMMGFGLALLALHLGIQPLGIAPSMILGLAVTLAWSSGLLMTRRRRTSVG